MNRMNRIDEIKARLKVATPGPWSVMAGAEWNVLAPEGYRIVWCRIDDSHNGTFADLVNAKLIAAAPSDIAYLLSEIERLESQVSAATLAERERCVNVAKRYSCGALGDCFMDGCIQAGYGIQDRVRQTGATNSNFKCVHQSKTEGTK